MREILSIERSSVVINPPDTLQNNLVFKPVEKNINDLPNLLYLSFHETPDDDGETYDDWDIEVNGIFEQKYGRIIQELSFNLILSDQLIGTFITTKFRSIPLIIYVAIHPDFRGNHFSEYLFNHAFNQLVHKTTLKELYLVVSKNNSVAYNLYHKLGFQKVGTNWDEVLIDLN